MTRDRIYTNDGIEFRALEGAGGFLLDRESGEYRQLNSMGSTIWRLLEAGPSRGELLADLRGLIKDPPPHMAEEVDRFLVALRERNLIRFEEDLVADKPG